MRQSSLTPVRLRAILAGILVLISGAGVGMFAFGYTQLKAHATAAQEVATQAEASRSSLENLTAVKKYLAENSSTVARADQLVAQSKLYVYQDKIIQDINAYASKAGLGIESITFDDESSKTTTSSTTYTSTSTPAGIKSTTATIAIASPTNYSALLRFMNLIEQSLFRMQISRIGIAHADQISGDNQLTSEVFTVEVYIRS